MKIFLAHETTAGTFYIGQSKDGRFHPIYNEEDLGSYAYPWQATEDLALGATFSILHKDTGEYLDTSELDIPEHSDEWERV